MKISTKKISVILVAAFVFAALSMSVFTVSAQSAETNAKITAAYGTPVIDGDLDAVWGSTEVQDVKLVDKDVIPSESKTTGTFRVMWDEAYLYVFLTVDKNGVPLSSGGGSENTDDCTEVAFTLNGDFEGEGNIGDEFAGVFRVLEDGAFGGFGGYQTEHLDSFKGVMKRTSDTSYTCEYAIPWINIKPSAGHKLSMEVQINDATENARTGLVTWAYVPCFGWRDSKYHGMVTLLAEPEPVAPETQPETEAPAATEAPPAPAVEETQPPAPPPAAPTTGDPTAVFVLICAAAAFALASKKAKAR